MNDTDRIRIEETIDLLDEVRGSIVTVRLTILEFSIADVGIYFCHANLNLTFADDSHSVQIVEASMSMFCKRDINLRYLWRLVAREKKKKSKSKY